MSDRERIIDALRDIADRERAYLREILGTDDTAEIAFILREAAHMLEEPEPRVLTVKDLRTLPPGTIVWHDGRADSTFFNIAPVSFERIDDGGYRTIEVPCIVYSDGYDDLDDYGRDFVLWTARPTEEQRKAVEFPCR